MWAEDSEILKWTERISGRNRARRVSFPKSMVGIIGKEEDSPAKLWMREKKAAEASLFVLAEFWTHQHFDLTTYCIICGP